MHVYYLYKRSHKSPIDVNLIYQNPLELKEALKFGLLFGIVFGATALPKSWVGDVGVYLSSLFSGLSDVDAITLSLSTLYADEEFLFGSHYCSARYS